FDQVLKQYANEKGLVDYNGIAKDPRFANYLRSLETAKIEDLSRDGRLAFWIDAYNAVIIDQVIKRKPKKSVRETIIPGVWTSTDIFTSRENVVANRRVSPDDIENDILRPMDPRVHFAIVCASMGCPPLVREAYTAGNVQALLDEDLRNYLRSPRGLRIDREKNTLYLSKIFEWFGNDFIGKSGSVVAFVRPYLNEEALSFLERKPEIAYLEYNWALNAKEPLRR
ncbi:MAG: DUF547 domain-containing protein, partial [Planctomycetaceae bacterium]